MGDFSLSEFPSQCRSVFLFFISLISLLLLLNSSNPHTPTLEQMNLVKSRSQQMSMVNFTQHVAYNNIP